MAPRRLSVRLVIVAVLAALLLLTAAPVAFAATGEPTLGLAELQGMLDAAPSHTVPGYMKTVLRGSTIETIPVEILALTGDSPSSSLILFRAYGPKIDAIGGIASGMSGSPVYVDDGGTDKVIGALSYGDWFTLGGTGLATPIESMLQLVSDYAPRVQDLSQPVLISGRVVDSVIVSAHPEKVPAATAAGAIVARPLATVFIGGLRPGTRAYQRLEGALVKRGIAVHPIGTALSASASDFSTELVPGAAVAALAARGDMWVGGIGTVTYSDEAEVLAYGHPAYWTGPTDLYMANAWISGVWPSANEPYKMGYPATLQGAFTQDRNAGIMGELGDPPAEALVTAEVTNTDTGRVGESTVGLSSELLDSGFLEDEVWAAVSVAGYQVFDAELIPGSAVTTTTVVVSDGTEEYTIVIPNVYDDGWDVIDAMGEDADWATYRLLSVLDNGLEQPHIVSVHLEAAVTSRRNHAEIVAVNAKKPLHEGRNGVRVSFLAYGVAATQTIDTTITIPEGAPLVGELVASAADSGGWDDYWIDETTTTERETIADVVDDLESTPAYNTVTVEFVPDTEESMFLPEDLGPIEKSVATPWYLNGEASAAVTEIYADVDTTTYGSDAWLTGEIYGPEVPVEVRVYALTEYGESEELLAVGMSEPGEDGMGFWIPLSGLTATTELRIAVDGGAGYTPAETYAVAVVRGRVRLSVTPKSMWRGSARLMTASVAPGTAGGTIKFQYYSQRAKKWRTIGTKRLTHTSTSARATCWWRPTIPGSTKVRAVYSGDWNLAGGKSSTVTVRIR